MFNLDGDQMRADRPHGAFFRGGPDNFTVHNMTI